jgi:hypothetical protein
MRNTEALEETGRGAIDPARGTRRTGYLEPALASEEFGIPAGASTGMREQSRF